MYSTTDNYIEASQEQFNPFLTLVVYRNGIDEYYIETHTINDSGKMLAGAPLTEECISDLASSFSVEYTQIPFGKVPNNMLYADPRPGQCKYIWFNPPQQRMMYFSERLNIPNAYYYVPGVLYVVENNHLDIYAFKGEKPTDKLYVAPFFNVTDASVCLGNATLTYPSNPSYQDLMDYWEKKFWLSEFSELGREGNPTKNNLFTATKKWKEKFDYKELLLSETSIKELIE